MKENQIKLRHTSRLILRKADKILLLERDESRGGYSLPGGKVDPHETPLEATKRETVEEIGLKIKKKHLKLVHTLLHRRKKNHYEIIYFYEAQKWKGQLAILEPHKFRAIRWFNQYQLPDELSFIFSAAIHSIQQNQKISYQLLSKKIQKK